MFIDTLVGAADGAESLTRALQRACTASVGEDAEVTDAVHPAGQDMKQEAADELVGRDGHGAVARLLLPGLPGLSMPEGDGLAVEGGDAAVGDGDPVGVAGEVPEDLRRPPEGPLGVDHPVPAAGGGECGVELAGVGEMGDGAVELQPASAMGASQLLEEASTEQAGEDLDGGQPGAAPDLPRAALDIEARVGHHHVQMGVEAELLIPGMEHGGAADTQAAMPGIGGDAAQGFGHRPEQDVEDDPAIAEGDGGDLRRQGEDDVEVGHGQDVGGARLAPSVCGETLAGGAVPVAAGVVERMLAPAPVAAVHVPAERGGAARLDSAHDLQPPGVEPAGHALTVGAAGAAEDIRNAGLAARHSRSDANPHIARHSG